MFIDRAKVKVRGGDGGHGCVSFRREKFVPKGGPNGGDGGRGGSVIFEATVNEQNLNAVKYLNHYEGGRGQHGMGKDRYGKHGDDVILKVPVGTIVTDLELGEVVCDLDTDGARFIAAKGGKGGRGNTHFLSNFNRAPRQAEDGQPGEAHEYELELKIIADIGLVGYPNAGKSTLLQAITNAKPEIAPYPFTTLHPNVGLVQYPEDFYRLTIADIPGLIDGAHDNVGLGHDFLRHIERTKILAFVLDTAGIDGRLPWEDLEHLKHELEMYEEGLSQRPAIIIANKMDEPVAVANLETLRERVDLPVYPICAILGTGCPELVADLRKLVEAQRQDSDTSAIDEVLD